MDKEDTEETDTKTAQTTTTGRQISQEEYDQLQEIAGRYSLIANDPQLSAVVLDHFRAKSGRLSQSAEPKIDNSKTMQNQQQEEAMAAMPNQELLRRQAQLEIELFRLRNPDMDSYKTEMASLVSKYPTMSLDDPYKFTQLAKPQAETKAVKENTAAPTTETNNGAGNFDKPSNSLEATMQKIADRKATPRIEDAIEVAWNAAKLQQGEEKEE